MPKEILVTYQVQVKVPAPEGGDEDDKVYMDGCKKVEDLIEKLPGYVSHDVDDESDI